MSGKETKFERVEKSHLDSTGNVTSREVTEDRGGEDPGMNFKDARNASLVPDDKLGMAPVGGVNTGVVPDTTRTVTTTTTSGLGARTHIADPALPRH